uniref:Protein phosphatase inhibitor n=1 Tax=Globisporangium ultimum (strain ATCC 200006 / CBS 805.95 / DAOM BR144) TaxID=431595 RepID=K3WJU1_GLOUD
MPHAAAVEGSRTVVATADREATEPPVYRMQLQPRARVTFDESVVDNEHLGRKKSNKCCIFHKKREFGESSSESGEDSSDDEDRHKKKHHHRNCKHQHHHAGKKQDAAQDSEPKDAHAH